MKVFLVKHNRDSKNDKFLFKFLLKLFSIDSDDRKISNKEKTYFLIKAFLALILIFSVQLHAFVFKVKQVYHIVNLSIIWPDFFQMFFDYIQYVVDLCFVYKYTGEVGVEYDKQYKCFDKILNVFVYSGIICRVRKLTMTFGMLWLTSCCVDFIGWGIGYGWILPVSYSPAYIFVLLKVLNNLDLTYQVIKVTCRLEVIGNVMQEYHSNSEVLPCRSILINMSDPVESRNWFYVGSCIVDISNGKRLKTLSHASYHEMRWLMRCYLLLSEQCFFINTMFGVRFLLNSLSILIDMVRFLNVGIRISTGNQTTPNFSGYVPVVSMVLRMSLCMVILTSLMHHCEMAYRQRERIISISTHILVNRNPDEGLRVAVTELRELVSSRPIVFTAAYFFKLNYSYLLSVTSIVVTYTIILLQSL